MSEDLTVLVTRGFQGVADQLRERDSKVTSLSEKVVVVELKLDQLKETLVNKNEQIALTMRVSALEEVNHDLKGKQQDNAKWIKGLVASVVLLLIGFLLNFVRISLS